MPSTKTSVAMSPIIYKFALIDNPYHSDESDAHGMSVLLMGRFYEASPDKALEVIRMIFRTDGDRVYTLSERGTRSLVWEKIVLGSFTSHWFEVMCGEVTHNGKEQPLRQSDLEVLGKRFCNTMAYLQEEIDWRMESKTKAEEFWTWLLHRTRKLGIDKTILTGPAKELAKKLQNTVKESYYDKPHTRGGSRPVWFDEQKDKGYEKDLESLLIRIKQHNVSKEEAKISESENEFQKLLGQDGESDLEKKRKELLTKARKEMRSAVENAGAGDGYSDCLQKGDSMLKKYGKERGLWLGDLLLSIPKDNLVKIATPYHRPPKKQTQKDKANITREFDAARLMLLGEIEISFQTKGWRANAISKICADEPKLKDELLSQQQNLKESFSDLQRGLSTCESCLL